MRNPYLSTALARPWAVTDTFPGREYVLWTYPWRWQAMLWAKTLGLGVRNLEEWRP